ncbi:MULTISPECIES: DUF6110 family protein [Peptoniphilus]|uniref:DUF6110 family protein n=1 Tax=Peptoniphilus TaxID=162289 RepID=UPI0001DA9B96|nr:MULTISPECIES: DUF6110 family protein [Peptoniphilus]EFI42153.1 hypothetical protein HMPREF0629_00793 [Peptoniphilus sp. oral taxon 386 str. F0131]
MKKKILNFALGMVTATVGPKILKSKLAKKVAVEAVVQGMKAKDYIDKTVETIKENTDDIIAEAKIIKAEEESKARETEFNEEDFVTEVKTEEA